MADQWWETDEQLLVALRQALTEVDTVPPNFLEAARASYDWRTVDAELAALAYDSAEAWSGREALTTRAESAVLRALTFSAPELSIELALSDDAILGQLVPPQPARVELHTIEGESVTATADGVGWFRFEPAPRRMCRLRCTVDSGRVVETSWMIP